MIILHEDADLFREAVRFTQSETGFVARLIEKDYFCSILIEYLALSNTGLVFKGGTCLSKVYADFYRLSEDLDYVITMPFQARRSERSSRAAGVKEAISALPRKRPMFRLLQPCKGANSSTQYIAAVGYKYLLSGQEESVKLEIGLREPLLSATHIGSAKALLRDPVTSLAMVQPISVPCIARKEAFAEKLRAALSRREVAIRDFYDIDYAIRRLGIRLTDSELVELVRAKLATPGNEHVDVTNTRMDTLRRQLSAQLKPVLREADFAEFNLNRAIEAVVGLARELD